MKKIVFLLMAIALGCQTKQHQNQTYQDIIKVVDKTKEIVSVKKGEQIDTARLRTCFLPTAHFTFVGEEDGKKLHETMRLNDFLASLTDEYYSNGYSETGKGYIVEEFNGIAHVMESFYGKDSEGEEGWGVNSYQLIYSKDRWQIVNMVWTMSEKGKDGIPKKLLEN